MVREEQAADYPRINDDLPDYNPRGCQKGALLRRVRLRRRSGCSIR